MVALLRPQNRKLVVGQPSLFWVTSLSASLNNSHIDDLKYRFWHQMIIEENTVVAAI